jgi:cytochrome c-type biogenesis protein CcmH
MRRATLVLALLLATPAQAVLPSEQMADPVLEARARAISQELRCVVCQNQSIDDSDAALAADLRVIVRERLAAGDSDEEAKAYIVSRYGHYVLMRPPFGAETLLLWLGPLLVVLAGGAGVALYLRRRHTPPVPLSDDEQARLAGLLKEEGPA